MTLSGEAGLALLAALLGMNNNNTNNNIYISGPGNSTSNTQLPQQLQPLSGVGIVRGTRMTTSAITPPSARARATTGVCYHSSFCSSPSYYGRSRWGIIHCASNIGVFNVSNMGVINVPSANPTTDNNNNAAMTGREFLLFQQLPNGVNDNSNNDNHDGGTNAKSREFASMLDSRLAATAIPPGDRTAVATAARYVSNQARLIASWQLTAHHVDGAINGC